MDDIITDSYCYGIPLILLAPNGLLYCLAKHIVDSNCFLALGALILVTLLLWNHYHYYSRSLRDLLLATCVCVSIYILDHSFADLKSYVPRLFYSIWIPYCVY